ncbi:hypothetical protein PAXRUDRAFT_834409 [Paxillus rubicundulus Ve08.2h10]|uniref:Unplaced genomic scaffold scaffold_1626, whole genome shotgun sequence n=1 Tax=Paxillus rubicundulus Ve08.2h10 TaxID=930991 RepID=A0A0D0CTW1_9AGAM|nr:hypothetical protein PAXRUDRAFT_834409 [Paxillus rubicundulus Ve08.2h10]
MDPSSQKEPCRINSDPAISKVDPTCRKRTHGLQNYLSPRKWTRRLRNGPSTSQIDLSPHVASYTTSLSRNQTQR